MRKRPVADIAVSKLTDSLKLLPENRVPSAGRELQPAKVNYARARVLDDGNKPHGSKAGKRRNELGRYERERPRSMGRYPFLNRVDEYLRDLTCAEPTFKERKRKLIMLGHEYNRILNEHPA